MSRHKHTALDVGGGLLQGKSGIPQHRVGSAGIQLTDHTGSDERDCRFTDASSSKGTIDSLQRDSRL